MSLRKKIFGSIFILVVIGIISGVYFLLTHTVGERKNQEGETPPDVPEIDLSFSSLEKAVLPEINFNLDFDLSNFEMSVPTSSVEEFVQIKDPQVNVDLLSEMGNFTLSAGNSNSSPPPTDAVCRQFQAAPSCSFVPQQYRELCEQCKSKGY